MSLENWNKDDDLERYPKESAERNSERQRENWKGPSEVDEERQRTKQRVDDILD